MKCLYLIIIGVMFISGHSCSTNEVHNHSEKDVPALVTGEDEEHGHAGSEAHMEYDHSVIKLARQSFAFVIKTGGRILVDSKDIEVITAKSSGILRFSDHFLFPGVKIYKGQSLFALSGERLADDNTELKFRQIEADLEKAQANYERDRLLIADKIITQEHFLSMKNEYEKALNEYINLNASFGKNGNIISSPENGFIREIYVSEGQKVTSGQILASLVMDHNMVLKADVSPNYFEALGSVEKAKFTVGYSDRIFRTDDMNGKKISFSKTTGEDSFYIPVYFRMDYDPSLIEGTFSEVYLIGKEIKEAIVVPNSSLMEEYGKIYVYVEDEDGDFLKRYIKTGYSDGESTQVTEGLNEGQTVVATGAHHIRLSQMSASAPAHTHNH